MKLVRCQKGHFYDADTYDTCPHCNGAEANDQKTQPLKIGDDIPTSKKVNVPDDYEVPKTVREKITDVKSGVITDDQKTVAKYKKDMGADPVVGWLVCTQGKHFGEDFKLKGGKNFVGRNESMDICLSKDGSVSRNKHVIVLYEPKSNVFLVQPGDSRELAYLNDVVILEAKQLKAYDAITVGSTVLVFVPFCSDKFCWDKKPEAEQ